MIRICTSLLFALLCGAASVAVAQIPQSGIPQAGLAFPDIPAAQIAADSSIAYVGGRRVVRAPSFDPLELVDGLAGTASLRSSDGDVSIDGVRLGPGAVLELGLVYTSDGGDPYDNLGFGRATYPSGTAAPVVLADARILNCSDTVGSANYRDDYWRGASSGIFAGLYRPYPRYRGHRRFGYGGPGFGYGYGFGRALIPYDLGRSYTGFGRPIHGGARADRRRDARRDARRQIDAQREVEREVERANRDRLQHRATRRIDPALRGEIRATPGFRAGGSRAVRGPFARDRTQPRRPNREIATNPARTPSARDRRRTVQPPAPVQPRRQSEPRPAARAEPRTYRRVEPRNPNRRAIKRAPPTRSRPAPKARPKSRPRRVLDFYPNDLNPGSGQRCAREELLHIHITQDRLRAARFDGLTLIVSDRDGGELPIYIPPNYLEGFDRARR